MKQLLLLRHFKSSWHEPGLADQDRPLAPRGQHDAVAIAEAMVSGGMLPDRILCSPARRTRETLAALLSGIGNVRDIVFIDALYVGPDLDYREIIAAKGGEADRLMVIGHNPRMHATAVSLVAGGGKGGRSQLAEKYPTGALAVIEFEADSWAEAARGGGRLTAFIRPRDLGDAF